MSAKAVVLASEVTPLSGAIYAVVAIVGCVFCVGIGYGVYKASHLDDDARPRAERVGAKSGDAVAAVSAATPPLPPSTDVALETSERRSSTSSSTSSSATSRSSTATE
jgi:hypothetical protein